jgi:hypothetical protein
MAQKKKTKEVGIMCHEALVCGSQIVVSTLILHLNYYRDNPFQLIKIQTDVFAYGAVILRFHIVEKY